ncbi:hypothetical protein SFC55_23805 [Niallia taxi]|uniref:hypothetical protein n=1 Tax=Niallia taxi TaxID=2499688 RepID=UPI0039824A88
MMAIAPTKKIRRTANIPLADVKSRLLKEQNELSIRELQKGRLGVFGWKETMVFKQ